MTTTEDLVNLLLDARRERHPVPAPELPDDAAAYAVQDGVANALGWFDAAGPRHWKSGGASRESELAHSPLPPAGVWVLQNARSA